MGAGAMLLDTVRQEAVDTGPFTYDDLLLTPEDGQRYEVLGGEMAVSPAPKWWHQRIVGKVIGLVLDAERAGFGVFSPAPTDVIFAAKNVTEPDVLFISKGRLAITAEDGVRGAPDLVVEVLSESTRKRDVLIKRRIYERFGVRFYWIVDPVEETVRVFELKDDHYGEPRTLQAGDRLGCPLFPGIEMDVATLFQEP